MGPQQDIGVDGGAQGGDAEDVDYEIDRWLRWNTFTGRRRRRQHDHWLALGLLFGHSGGDSAAARSTARDTI